LNNVLFSACVVVACAGPQEPVREPDESTVAPEATEAPAAAPSASTAASAEPTADTGGTEPEARTTNTSAPTTTTVSPPSGSPSDHSWEGLVKRADGQCNKECADAESGQCYTFCVNSKFPCRSECNDDCRSQALTIKCMNAFDRGQHPPHCDDDSSSAACKSCLEHCDWDPK